MNPCSGFIEEVLSVDTDADADARTNSARISHPPSSLKMVVGLDSEKFKPIWTALFCFVSFKT